MILAEDDTEKLGGYQEKKCRRCRDQGFIHWPSEADEMDSGQAAECCCQLSDSLVFRDSPCGNQPSRLMALF